MLKKIKHVAALTAMAIGAAASLPVLAQTTAQQLVPMTVAPVLLGQLAGSFPVGRLLIDHGTVYGATLGNAGTIFSRPDTVPTQSLDFGTTLLYAFKGPDGQAPNGGLIADTNGNLYGTTRAGGANGFGTVFKLTRLPGNQTPWPLTTIHSFTGGSDGAAPTTSLTFGPDGSLYGTTSASSSCTICGTFFKVTTSGSFTTIHTFGDLTLTNVAVDPTGVVIGAIHAIGPPVQGLPSYEAELVAVAPSGVVTVVANFGQSATVAGDIVRDSKGNIYGTGRIGDFVTPVPAGQSAPMFWRVTAGTHVESMLSTGVNEGGEPNGVIRDGAGNLYTTTNGTSRVDGGEVLVSPASQTSGTPATVVATLSYANQGPLGNIAIDPAGVIWGTSSAGGNNCPSTQNITPTGCGTLFVLVPPQQ